MRWNLDALPEHEIVPGFHGRFVHTETMTFAYWAIDAAATIPAHAHHHQQVVNMLAGELELTVDGTRHTLRAGDVYEYQVSTEAGSNLTLLCREPLESSLADSGREFGIVGAIVDNPAQNVRGYSGTARRAIWLTRAIPLD